MEAISRDIERGVCNRASWIQATLQLRTFDSVDPMFLRNIWHRWMCLTELLSWKARPQACEFFPQDLVYFAAMVLHFPHGSWLALRPWWRLFLKMTRSDCLTQYVCQGQGINQSNMSQNRTCWAVFPLKSEVIEMRGVSRRSGNRNKQRVTQISW